MHPTPIIHNPSSFCYLCISMKITIDSRAGFCPGVQRAITKAEENLENREVFYSLGSLLHNEQEMRRLGDLGLKVAKTHDISKLSGEKLLIRAHGEPPETFKKANKHGIEVINATCPVVSRLQRKISDASEEMQQVDGQLIIFGKKDHPEVIGLVGNANGLAKVISNEKDLEMLDYGRPVRMFSQTTMDGDQYEHVSALLKAKMSELHSEPDFVKFDTICHHVTNRIPALKKFATQSEVIIFVSGSESSNGKKLFSICSEVNPRSYFISQISEFREDWVKDANSVGISGAASTPLWLMEKVVEKIKQIN